jgi:two-component system response regulator AdeR
MRILIVEDEEDLGVVMASALRKRGWRVMRADDALTGFRAFRSAHYDLILLDVVLPVVGGIELLRMIRNESQVPVVLMSGRMTPEIRAAALKLGVVETLRKPFKGAELVSCVARGLKARQPAAA